MLDLKLESTECSPSFTLPLFPAVTTVETGGGDVRGVEDNDEEEEGRIGACREGLVDPWHGIGELHFDLSDIAIPSFALSFPLEELCEDRESRSAIALPPGLACIAIREKEEGKG